MKLLIATRLSVAIAALLFSALAAAPIVAQAPAASVPTTLPIPNDIHAALAQAILSRPAGIFRGDRPIITSLDRAGDTAIATVGQIPDSADEGEEILTHSTLALARLSDGRWSAELFGTSRYEEWLDAAPTALVSSVAKPFLSARAPTRTPSAPTGVSTVLMWPWKGGAEWEYWQGVNHSDHHEAIDLGPHKGALQSDRAVVAAADGVVIRRCEDGIQNNVLLRHATGNASDDVTGYLHLDKNTVHLATGASVARATALGYLLNLKTFQSKCGYGSGSHLHFYTAKIVAGSNDPNAITYIPIAGTIISGWTLGADSCFTKIGFAPLCVGYPTFITSDNYPAPPSATWVNPAADTTLNARTIALLISPGGGSGGIDHIRFSAVYGGSEHEIATLTTAPWVAFWDWCATGVPNGNVELSVQVWDRDGNTSGKISVQVVKNFDSSDGQCFMLSPAVSPVFSGGVTVAPTADCVGKYHSGDSVMLTAAPADSFEFSGWSGGASGTTNPVIVIVNANTNVTANFAATRAPDQVTLLAPKAGIKTLAPNVSLDWGDSVLATEYKVEVHAGSASGAIAESSSPADSEYSTKALLAGKYFWRVRACNAIGCSPWTASRPFTVIAPAKPRPLSPANRSTVTSQPVTLDWTDSIGATRYHVVVNRDSKTGDPVVDSEPAESTLTTTAYTLEAGHRYFWRAQACSAAGCGAWSAWRRFKIP